jgi:hypothetical protein
MAMIATATTAAMAIAVLLFNLAPYGYLIHKSIYLVDNNNLYVKLDVLVIYELNV